jgi:predicted nuclease with TOPRIM domain
MDRMTKPKHVEPLRWWLGTNSEGTVEAINGPELPQHQAVEVIEHSAYEALRLECERLKERAFEFETKYNRVIQINKEYVDSTWRNEHDRLAEENRGLSENLAISNEAAVNLKKENARLKERGSADLVSEKYRLRERIAELESELAMAMKLRKADVMYINQLAEENEKLNEKLLLTKVGSGHYRSELNIHTKESETFVAEATAKIKALSEENHDLNKAADQLREEIKSLRDQLKNK